MFKKFAWMIALSAATLSIGLSVYGQNRTITAAASDRERDGLVGPVRRVTVESAKITIKNDSPVEGSRLLREVTTYDPRGKKIDNVAYPIESTTPPGTERYKYDDNGNIVEMELRSQDGAIISKEHYKYVLDEVGNWKQMTTSLAVFEDGKLAEEPVEVTYRSITYFYSDEIARLASTAPKEKTSEPASNDESGPRPVEKPRGSPEASTQTNNETDTTRTTEPPFANPVETSQVQSKNSKSEPSTELVSAAASTTPLANPAASDSEGSTSPKSSKDTDAASNSISTNVADSEHPTTAKGYYSLGLTYLESGRKTEAAEALNQAIFRDPEYVPAYVRLGVVYTSLQKYKEAVAVFKMALRIKRDVLDSEAYFQMGHAYTGMGKHSEALNAFKQALYISRADALTIEGEKATHVPTVEELHYNLGLAYNNLGRYSDAIKELNQVLAVNPQSPEAHYGLAVCYIGLGDRQSAEKQQKILATLNPDLAARITEALSTNKNIPPGLSEGILGGRRRN